MKVTLTFETHSNLDEHGRQELREIFDSIYNRLYQFWKPPLQSYEKRVSTDLVIYDSVGEAVGKLIVVNN